MAYPQLAEPGVTPVFDNMMMQHLLKNNLFAFYLAAESSSMDSDLTFGYYDKTKFSGSMIWHPIEYKYMFGIQLDDILVNGESLGLCGPNGIREKCLITVDSGTSYMAMPGWAYETVGDKLPTANGGIECDTGREWGSMTYVINGQSYSFSPKEWIYPPSPSGSIAATTNLEAHGQLISHS